LEENAIFAVTVIEIRPFRNGWELYESPGFELIENGRANGALLIPMGLTLRGQHHPRDLIAAGAGSLCAERPKALP
jgi:hypothetical protein